MATKIYRVAVRSAINADPQEHLVRATSAQQAQAHVTQGMIVTEVADQDDLYRLAKAGAKLEDATTAKPAAPAPAPAAKTPKAGSK